MTLKEFSEGFDEMLDSYKLKNAYAEDENLYVLKLDEYEKSLYLTNAQNDLVTSLYSGIATGKGYEETEEIRRYLASLNKTLVVMGDKLTPTNAGVAPKSKIANIADDEKRRLMFITLEQAMIDYTGDVCQDGYWVDVMPVRRDEYLLFKRNPFRNKKVFRIDYGFDKVELIYDKPIRAYKVCYVARPKPIILEDLDYLTIDGISTATECELPAMLHPKILESAVIKAFTFMGSQMSKNSDNKDS